VCRPTEFVGNPMYPAALGKCGLRRFSEPSLSPEGLQEPVLTRVRTGFLLSLGDLL